MAIHIYDTECPKMHELHIARASAMHSVLLLA